MQYQDISIVPDVALPYSGHTDHGKSVEGVSLRTNMNNSTSEPVSSSRAVSRFKVHIPCPVDTKALEAFLYQIQ